ncbi:MAG: signal peptidase I [Jiangellaceae bacterium]
MRVVAVAGDEIAAEAGVLTINGEPADEPHLAADVATPDLERVIVPAGHVFILGDNRGNAADSRLYGRGPTRTSASSSSSGGGP